MSEPLPVADVLLLPVLLLALAWAGATVSAAFAASAAGRPFASGLGAPVREAVRLLHARRRTTLHPDALLWRVGGGAVLTTAVLAVAVVPWGDRAIVAFDAGVVWFNAAETLLWAALWLTGWGANSAAGLVGGYRFVAFAVAYELPFMLALITAAIPSASLDPARIAAEQADLWSVVTMPVAFAVYLVATLAFSFYGPFAQPAAGDVAGGVLAELSGVDRLVVLVGQYAWLAAASAMAVPLFLGGGAGPLLPPLAWQVVKTLAVLGLLVALRWRLPLVRAERFEEIAWVVLLPAVLLQALVVSVLVL